MKNARGGTFALGPYLCREICVQVSALVSLARTGIGVVAYGRTHQQLKSCIYRTGAQECEIPLMRSGLVNCESDQGKLKARSTLHFF